MEEILAIILSYVSIWAPSLVAIHKCKEAFDKLNKDETLKEVKTKLNTVASENEELIRCNKLLLEELTKIRGYADAKKKEK